MICMNIYKNASSVIASEAKQSLGSISEIE